MPPRNPLTKLLEPIRGVFSASDRDKSRPAKLLIDELSLENPQQTPAKLASNDGIQRDRWGVPVVTKQNTRESALVSDKKAWMTGRKQKKLGKAKWESDQTRKRLDQARRLVMQGVPQDQIEEALAADWGLSVKSVSFYIARAKEEMEGERQRLEQVKQFLGLLYPKQRIKELCMREWQFLTEAACEIHPSTDPQNDCPDCGRRIENLSEYVDQAIEAAEQEADELASQSPLRQISLALQTYVTRFRQAEQDYGFFKSRETLLRNRLDKLQDTLEEHQFKFEKTEFKDDKEKEAATNQLKQVSNWIHRVDKRYNWAKRNRIEAESRVREYRVRLDKIYKLESSGQQLVPGNYTDNRTQVVQQINYPGLPAPTPVYDEAQRLLALEGPKQEPLTLKDIDDELVGLLKDPELAKLMREHLEEDVIDAEYIPATKPTKDA